MCRIQASVGSLELLAQDAVLLDQVRDDVQLSMSRPV